MQVGNSVQSLVGVQGAREGPELPSSELSQKLNQSSPQVKDAMGLNVGDTGTAEPGGNERLTGTHRRMVSRLLIEAKFNTALN